MAKPSKRRWAVEKRQNGVLTRQRQQKQRKAKAAKVAARLMGVRKPSLEGILKSKYQKINGQFYCKEHAPK